MVDDSASSDARMAADVDPVTDESSRAQIHAVADDCPDADLRPTVDPASMPHPGAGTDTRAGLNIGHRTDARTVSDVGPCADQAPSVGVSHVAGDLAGVVFY
jgi:hypothetical protein